MTEPTAQPLPRRILLVRRSSLGDVTVGLPALVALRRACPNAYIAWLVEDRFASVMEGHECLSELITMRRFSGRRWADWLREARDVGNLLREKEFDLAVDLQGRAKSALMCYLSCAPRRVGYRNEFRGLPGLPMINEVVTVPDEIPAVDRTLAMVRYLGVDPEPVEFRYPISAEAAGWADGFLSAWGADRAPLIGLVLGASQPNKCWPPGHFARLAALLRAEGLGAPLLLGGQGELEREEAVQELSDATLLSAVGRTNLAQLAALLGRCKAVVAGDTGAIHMAVALDRPVVGLYGPTSPRSTGPWGPRASVLWQNPPCGPCVRNPTCRDFHCMSDLTPERVQTALRDLLRSLR